MIKQTTLTGTAEEIRARIARMRDLGIRQVAIAGGDRTIRDFAENVLAQMP
jgi:predicted polyphosphate/ATP-dependent NAD kinase